MPGYNPIILANANRKVREGFQAAFASFMGPIKNAKDARREAERHFAYALAMESVAQTYANLPEDQLKACEDEINAAVRRKKHEIAKSPEFNAVCLKLDNGAFFRLSNKWEKNAEGKSVEKPVSVTEFKERYDTKVREISKEVEEQKKRDRFNAFMKGLATVMEPQEFKDYCEQINASRKALDKNNKALVSAKDYMSPEKYQQLEKEQKKTEPVKTEPVKTETVKTGQEPQDMVL